MGRAYSCRDLVHDHHDWEHGGRQLWYWRVAKSHILIDRPRKREGEKKNRDFGLGLGWAFETSMPTPSDTSSNKATLPDPSNPIKEFYSLVTKHSIMNLWE